jgi:hypothetical protein
MYHFLIFFSCSRTKTDCYYSAIILSDTLNCPLILSFERYLDRALEFSVKKITLTMNRRKSLIPIKFALIRLAGKSSHFQALFSFKLFLWIKFYLCAHEFPNLYCQLNSYYNSEPGFHAHSHSHSN